MNIKTVEYLNSAYTLTTSYVALQWRSTRGDYQCRLDLRYTMGDSESGNKCRIYIETANPIGDTEPVANDWVAEKEESIAGGVATQTLLVHEIDPTVDSGKISISIPCDFKYIRIYAKEVNTPAANAGTLVAKVTHVEDNQY